MARLHLLLHHRTTRAELPVLTIITKPKHLAMLVNLLTAQIILILHFLTNNFDQHHTNTTQLSRSRIINLSNADSYLLPRRRTCSQRFLKHQRPTHNLITARTALLPSYHSTRLPRQVAVSASSMLSNGQKLIRFYFIFGSTLHIYTRMAHLGPRRHLRPLPPLLLHLHVLAQAGPRMRRLLLLLPTTRRYHRHRRHLHNTTTRRA
jgi:hypothetical protein